jgi:hypothetical protein
VGGTRISESRNYNYINLAQEEKFPNTATLGGHKTVFTTIKDSFEPCETLL